jgi:Glycosyl hydrolase family 12
MRSMKLLSAYALTLTLLSCSTQSPILPVPTNVSIADSSVADWGGVSYAGNGDYLVVNNVWNKSAAKGPYRQEVFSGTLDGANAFGWRWDWPINSMDVFAYPEIVYGDKPWDFISGRSSPFPVIASTALITAKFNVKIRATGKYNLAFTVWATSEKRVGNDPDTGKITNEIMIWTSSHGFAGAGTIVETKTIDGHAFDVWVRENHADASGGSTHKWTYTAFVPKEEFLEDTLTLSDFTDYLIAKGYLNGSHFLTSVELGNEIMSGSGVTEITDYAITVATKPESAQ